MKKVSYIKKDGTRKVYEYKNKMTMMACSVDTKKRFDEAYLKLGKLAPKKYAIIDDAINTHIERLKKIQ